MATSGSVNFSLTRDQIITEAFGLCGLYDVGNTPSADEVADAARSLNMMVKAWQAKGYHLWSYQEATLFLDKSVGEYSIGPSGDHATTSYVQTTLSAAGSASDGTIDVASITGISDGDYIGIVLDDDDFQWTTVNGAPSGSTVTLTAALTGAAASGNRVYAYTTKAGRPLRIVEARRRDTSDIDTPLEQVSRQEYFDLSNKTTASTINQYYYEPQLTNGKLYLWPEPSSVDDIVRFSYARTLEDFDSTSDEPDFPQEWLEALSYNLAVRIAPKYGVPISNRQWLKAEAEQYLFDVMSWDTGPESVYFGVDFER